MTLKGIAAAALLLGTATAFAAEGAAPTDITAAERAKGMYFMEAANRKLFAAVEGLTPEQWNFKPAPDRWSVAETLEHLTIIQDVVLGILAKLNTGAVAPAGHTSRHTDQIFEIKATAGFPASK